MAAPVVAVVGMRALNRDLARLTGTRGPLNAALVAAGRAAAEPVAAATRSALPQDSGRLAGDVRVTASRSGAAVRMGRTSIRYAGWVEFGGTRRAPHQSTRDYDPRGRYMFPKALSLASTAAQLYSRATSAELARARWTNESGDGQVVHD